LDPGDAAAVPAAHRRLIEASQCWDEAALAHGEKHGYRNSQVTVLAPTGTIGFMMDCDTTGIEPDLALVKYKKLVGGGMIKIVNNTVRTALFKLGYKRPGNAIVSYIDATGTIEGAPGLKDEHLPVFDCSFKPAKGTRSIHYMGHVKMMAADAAVHLRRHLEDGEPARERHGRRDRRSLHRILEARPQGGRHLPRRFEEDLDLPAAEHLADVMEAMAQLGDAPLCQSCGAIMVRNGSCYKCIECGGTSGCS
jgi:hypothetical protein